MEFLVRGLLPRIPKIERLKHFSFDVVVHPNRDPGIFNEANELLKLFPKKYSHCLVILDHEGSGQEKKSREKIEEEIHKTISQVGWENRICVICIQPELENWIWVSDVRLREAVSWNHKISIYEWLQQNKLKHMDNPKPEHPKEAFERVLRACKTPRSSSLYEQIASRASYKYCQDPAFCKMLDCLKKWFAVSDAS